MLLADMIDPVPVVGVGIVLFVVPIAIITFLVVFWLRKKKKRHEKP